MLQSRDKKSNSNTRRGDNSKSKKAEVVILVRDMSSGPVLHYYQISSKYSKECSTYCRLVLFFITTKYHQNIPKSVRLSYIADTKSMHNQCQI